MAPEKGKRLTLGVVLFTAVFCSAIVGSYLLGYHRAKLPRVVTRFAQTGNLVRKLYPDVDFTKVYPGLTPQEIDQIQRECCSVTYRYEPFVQFKPAPMVKQYVTIYEAGFRKGSHDQPWPPAQEELSVFVFGGSTTFGYGVPNEQTVPSHLEEALRQESGARVQCYNFGSGYYFSTQEKALFESLLLAGQVPNLAVFIDGLNEFYYADGRPAMTEFLFEYISPDMKYAPPPAREESAMVRDLLTRYQRNVMAIEAVGSAFGVEVLFVGQPVPFYQYPRNQETYPFLTSFAGHQLAQNHYGEFAKKGTQGDYGRNFVWCGDLFSGAVTPMYIDGVHYSYEGARRLARHIARRLIDSHRGTFSASVDRGTPSMSPE